MKTKMKLHKWKDLRKETCSPESLEKIDQEVKEEILKMNLKEIRKMLGLTQVDVAKLAKMNQSDLSRTEHRDDHLISTLRRYVKALGGDIEIIARFGNKSIHLL